MLTDERYKQLMNALGMPNSVSLYEALKQVANEVEQRVRAEVLQAQEPVAWMSPGKERIEFSRPDTVYGSHTVPLYAAPQPPAPCPKCAERQEKEDRMRALIASGLVENPKHQQARYTALQAKVAEQSAEIERLTKARWCPDICPITGREFFMWIEHYESGRMVPTYGGPFDSYTIPTKGDDGEYQCERYDHDEGGWLVDEVVGLGLRLCNDQHEDYEFGTLEARDATIAQQSERIAELEKECGSNLRMFQAAILDLASISEELNCDPDEGGAAPIIDAIDELKARIAELEAKLPEIARNIEAGKAENAAQSAALAKAREALEVALETDQLLGGLLEERANESLAAIAALKGGSN